MSVRRYEKADFEQVSSWGRKWDREYRPSQFPEHGFIVDGHAAYFLYKTDSTVCFLENLISNRDIDGVARTSAIDIVTEALLHLAKELGFEIAYAVTDNPAVVIRAIRLGATITEKQVLLTKVLAHLP